MTENELRQQDDEIAHLAIEALTAAQQRAISSGHPLVMVIDGELVRIGPQGRTVLKKLPPRLNVSVQVKKAKS